MTYSKFGFLLIALLAVGCDGDSTTTPTGGMEVDTRPARAVFTISETGDTILGFSPSAAHLFRLRLPIQIQETAGLAGALNFVRLRFYLGGEVIETAEMTADRITAKAGSNRIPARGSLALDLDFDFNAVDFDDLVLTFGLRDDRGNEQETEFDPQGNIVLLLDVLELKGHFQSVPGTR